MTSAPLRPGLVDVVVIGGGQAGLAVPMPATDGYPGATHVIDYLAAYEKRYELPVHREAEDPRVETDHGSWTARRVISATGTWWQPYLPHYPGQATFQGRQLHTTGYLSADPGIETFWATLRRPRLLPDHVDGRALFEIATRRRAAVLAGTDDDGGVAGLGDIVAVPPVRAARERGDLRAHPMFDRLTTTGIAWPDGTRLACDATVVPSTTADHNDVKSQAPSPVDERGR
ncbi:hypothetical protein [Actinomadura algeriensis]|uniref:Glycine/D-amino acid oxidase-like deaminating enzyme n=1 Tax=Actinomadura algeriensis TaxID=1679523 RepID=A0ABR9JYY5_9ACTN|nr:hypothetical protein [Actinomadura algeriensis]MBE1535608.1 glycine/D-amino acid oxidase-like deaminating enzyme [Actinomadura algeriensis]